MSKHVDQEIKRVQNFRETELNDGIFRSDDHSLHLTAVSKQQRTDLSFDEDGLLAKHKEELDKIQPILSNIMVIEDTTNRGSKVIITKFNRHYQFKGLVYSTGPECTDIKKGDWVIWGLYRGMPFDDMVKGLKIWFFLEENVLVKCEKDTLLSQ